MITDRAPPLVGAIEGGGTKFVCAVGRPAAQILDRITIPTTDAATTLVGLRAVLPGR